MTLTRGGPDSEVFLERVRSFFLEKLPLRPDYEERPEQLEMALAVARALAEEELLVVEAGTGTGKSLAYLIPSLLWSFQHGQPVIISTRTLNLQQQLLEKDIPLLRELLDQPFRATAARGWSNYVCLRRLDTVQNSEQLTPELAHEAGELAEVLGLGAPGIRQKLPVTDGLWSLVHADSHACNRQLCPHYNDCYLFRERREMERSELIIANHSLVMADVALRAAGAQGILPKPACWVLDEGHHLEEVANDHLGRSVSLADLQRLRQTVFDPKGKINDAGCYRCCAIASASPMSEFACWNAWTGVCLRRCPAFIRWAKSSSTGLGRPFWPPVSARRERAQLSIQISSTLRKARNVDVFLNSGRPTWSTWKAPRDNSSSCSQNLNWRLRREGWPSCNH